MLPLDIVLDTALIKHSNNGGLSDGGDKDTTSKQVTAAAKGKEEEEEDDDDELDALLGLSDTHVRSGERVGDAYTSGTGDLKDFLDHL